MSGGCNGMCVDSGDIGVPGYGIAYPHPLCPEHGDPEHHEHTWSRDPSRPGMAYCGYCWTDGPPLSDEAGERP